MALLERLTIEAVTNAIQYSGCKVVGVDLSANNIAKAKQFLEEESSTLDVEFHESNFFNLPADIKNGSFTHVWAQVSK